MSNIQQGVRGQMVDDIARVCHEANRAYCLSLGDTSQKPWDETSFATKQSAIAGVVFVQDKPDAPLNFLHENWRKRKEAEGWVYGKTKDEDKKEHPCMLPYEHLPAERQIKDRLFRSIVTALTRGENHD